jgi:hypothetical protein
MRFLFSIVIAVGVALTVSGLFGFIFGLAMKEPINVHTRICGLEWVNGDWWPGQYCFLGALLASLGSGLITFGGLNRPWKHGS